MTLEVLTKSHGGVESGFFGPFTQLARLGKYTFATKVLCLMSQYLAENPDKKEIEILGYDIDKFWEIEEEYCKNLVKLISNTPKSFISTFVGIYLEQNQGEVPEKDAQDLARKGEIIPVSIDDDEESITIGEYKIADIHFGRMIHYLANGGLFGWEGEKPDYAKSTTEAIKKSKNPLFKKLQKEI